MYAEELHELLVVLDAPFFSTDVRVEGFVPTFTALLANPARQAAGHGDPVSRANVLDPLD